MGWARVLLSATWKYIVMVAHIFRTWFAWTKAVYALVGVALALLLIRQVVALSPEEVTVQGRLHLAQSGENLAAIAEHNGLELNAILALNELDSSDSLWIGQPVRLPAASTNNPGLGALNGIHHVSKHETLHAVALQYGLHPVELAHLNHMAPNEVLFAGQELRVPSLHNWAKMVEQGYMQRFPTHVMQEHETLTRIAERFGITEEELRVFNALVPTDVPPVGAELLIPPPSQRVDFAVDIVNPTSLGQLVRLKEKWIEVDLGTQEATAFMGMTPVRHMPISSGTSEHPTVTGLFRIWAKAAVQDMSQGSRSTQEFEFLEGVPWVQYFYQDFALQGTYWPLQAGQPSSHGNVLLQEDDAAWLYGWTTPNSHSGFEVHQGWILVTRPTLAP